MYHLKLLYSLYSLLFFICFGPKLLTREVTLYLGGRKSLSLFCPLYLNNLSNNLTFFAPDLSSNLASNLTCLSHKSSLYSAYRLGLEPHPILSYHSLFRLFPTLSKLEESEPGLKIILKLLLNSRDLTLTSFLSPLLNYSLLLFTFLTSILSPRRHKIISLLPTTRNCLNSSN